MKNYTQNDIDIMNLMSLFVDMIIHIEISITFQIILIIYFLKNINTNTNTNITNTSRCPNYFNKFNIKLYYENENESIKPSTLILLLLKFVSKLGILNSITNSKTENSLVSNYIKIKKTASLKSKECLDTFILQIANYFENNSENSNTNNIYKLCIDHIFAIIDLIFSQYTNVFDILEKIIIIDIKNKSNSENKTENQTENQTENKTIIEEKIKKFKHIKSSIYNLIDIEIHNKKSLFTN